MSVDHVSVYHMPSDENKALVRRVVDEVWNRQNLAAIDELFAADLVDHGLPPGVPPTREGVKQFAAAFWRAFPDGRMNVEDQIAERDLVVTRWTARATHLGELMGIPPTGRQVVVSGINVDRVAGGMIVEAWSQFDQVGMLRQLGAMPAPEAATTAPALSPVQSVPGTDLVPPSASTALERRGPKPRFLLGHLLELSRDQLGFLRNCARQYGDIVPLWFGRRPVILLSHPDQLEEVLVARRRSFAKGYFYRVLGRLLGNGLITSEDDVWLRQRRLAQPAFHRQRINAYAETMASFTRELRASWHHGQVRDVNADMNGLTLRIVGKTLFDADLETDATDIRDAIVVALAELGKQTTGPELLLPAAIPTPSRLRLGRAVRRLDAIIYQIIEQRRSTGVDRGDLLSALLQAQDQDGSQMTDRQLRDEAMTILVAGHETTALALTWAWYLLAQHPAAEARLHEELARVLGNRAPTAADVARLPFTSAVISESLRLYPPIWSFGRETAEETHVDGYPVRKGTLALLNTWTIQRDPRYYADPDAFRPERWLDGLAQRLPRFAYLPFGGGPRQCIGNGFALLEAALVLATIAQRYRLVLEPGQTITAVPAGTLRPSQAVRVRLEAREAPSESRPRHGAPADQAERIAVPPDRSSRAEGASASASPVQAS